MYAILYVSKTYLNWNVYFNLVRDKDKQYFYIYKYIVWIYIIMLHDLFFVMSILKMFVII